MWTTSKELAWLTDHIPGLLRAREAPGQQIQGWLRTTASDFVTAFPEHSTNDIGELINVWRPNDFVI